MTNTVTIDCFPECVARYRRGYAIVAIDVVRATTTAVTAAALGRRCFPAPTVAAALEVAAGLDNPLLAGEQRGVMPAGFDLNNSPSALASRTDLNRALVLLSSSGTRLCHEVASCDVAYLACLRNYTAVADHLAFAFPRIAVIGAGTRGEFREEDQMCCAWVAERLVHHGYRCGDETTGRLIRRWSDAAPHDWLGGKSAAYLRGSGQAADLDFILRHIDDLCAPFALDRGEVVIGAPRPRTAGASDAGRRELQDV